MSHEEESWIVSVFQLAVVDDSIIVWPADCYLYVPWLGIPPKAARILLYIGWDS